MSEGLITAESRGAVSDTAPCGANLEYDSRFQELLRISEGTREQQYGRTIVAAKPPDWKQMRDLAANLLPTTRDLRLGVLVVEIETHFSGLRGCASGLEMLRQWIVNLWPNLYPSLEDDEDDDHFMRINALARLCEPQRLPSQLQNIDIVEVPPHTKITIADIEALRGHGSGRTSSIERMTTAEIEAAFLAADLSQLRFAFDECQQALHSLTGIVTFLERTIGAAAWDAALLRQRLRDAVEITKHYLRKRLSIADSAVTEVSVAGDASNIPAIAQLNSDASFAGIDAGSPFVTSRGQAAEMLDRITEFFESQEPSSPVPILLRRAKRLINQDFVGILRELAPDSLAQVQELVGSTSESS